jgi:hypothetical protein
VTFWFFFCFENEYRDFEAKQHGDKHRCEAAGASSSFFFANYILHKQTLINICAHILSYEHILKTKPTYLIKINKVIIDVSLWMSKPPTTKKITTKF